MVASLTARVATMALVDLMLHNAVHVMEDKTLVHA